MNVTSLQAEHKEWVNRMFPGQELWCPAMVLLEEVGELTRCVSKILQAKRWEAEPRYADKDWKPDLIDAIGDVFISLLSVCNAGGVQLSDAKTDVNGDRLIDLVADMASASAAIVSAAAGHTSLGDDPDWCLSSLKAASFVLGVDFDSAVTETWERVKRRRR